MITLHQDTSCNEWHVDQLAKAAALGMEKASIPDITSPSDILSAAFTFLGRTLVAMRKLEDPSDRVYNARKIGEVLSEFLVDFGQVPS